MEQSDRRRPSRYGAFISYAHADDRIARRLHHWLETYRFPRAIAQQLYRRRFGRVFLDRSELATSQNLSTDIEAALLDADALVVLCSPAAAASHWVNEEIRRFRQLGKGDCIFCLIIDGDPSGRNAPSPFPPALHEGDAPLEPLAADMRKGKDGPAAARLKLLAGLIGVPFDALRRREQARRQRLLAVALGVTLALFAVMTFLAINAILARREAERQRDQAVRTANFMREIFVGAAPNADGTPVTVQAMLDRATNETLQDQQLGRAPDLKAALLITLAQVHLTMGNVQRAEDLIAQAPETTSDRNEQLNRLELASRIALQQSRHEEVLRLGKQAEALSDPDDPINRTLFTVIQLLVGQAAFAAGDMDKGRAALTLARRLALAASPPDRARAALALTQIGIAEIGANQVEQGSASLKQAIRERAALRRPNDPDLLVALSSLGAATIMSGKVQEAEQIFRQTLQRQAAILGPHHFDTARTRNNLGRALVEQRRFVEAIAALEQSRRVIVEQLGPQTAMLANLHDSLGLAYAGFGRHGDAARSFAAGVAVARLHQLPKESELLGDWAESECASAKPDAGLARLAAARRTLPASAEPWRIARLDDVEAGCWLAKGDRQRAARLVRSSAAAIDQRWPGASLFRTASLRHRAAVQASAG